MYAGDWTDLGRLLAPKTIGRQPADEASAGYTDLDLECARRNRLSARVKKEMTNPENQPWLSSTSVWELILFQRKRRVELDEELGA
jgi:hypothetical protein